MYTVKAALSLSVALQQKGKKSACVNAVSREGQALVNH